MTKNNERAKIVPENGEAHQGYYLKKMEEQEQKTHQIEEE